MRVDSGVELGSEVTTHYDSLLAKVIAHAPTRASWRSTASTPRWPTWRSSGRRVNTAFLRRLLADPRRARRATWTPGWSSACPAAERDPEADAEAAAAAALARTLELGATAGATRGTT